MAEVTVEVDGTEFLVEVADGGGPQVVGLDHAFSFDSVRSTVEAIAGQLSRAWEQSKPTEATVEFGLSLSTKTGKLSALLVEGGGEASLKVTLVWKAPDGR